MDPFSLDSYVIKRPKEFSFSMNYDCLDTDGNKVLEVRRNTLGTQYNLFDTEGRHLGSVHHKILALQLTFELLDDEKRLIGRVIKKVQTINNFEHHFELSDEKGTLLALAGGDYLKFNYIISNADGTRTIANVTEDLSGEKINRSIFSKLLTASVNAFMIRLQDKDFSRRLLLEFTLAIDMLANMPQSRAPLGPLTPSPAPAPPPAPGSFSVKA